MRTGGRGFFNWQWIQGGTQHTHTHSTIYTSLHTNTHFDRYQSTRFTHPDDRLLRLLIHLPKAMHATTTHTLPSLLHHICIHAATPLPTHLHVQTHPFLSLTLPNSLSVFLSPPFHTRTHTLTRIISSSVSSSTSGVVTVSSTSPRIMFRWRSNA